jgi:FkbM family methyltransferase
VIDAGAYTGDSARRFAWQLRGRGKIVSLEPDPKSFAKLHRTRIPGLLALNVGAWHERARLSFSEAGGSSSIGGDGSRQIDVCTIDEIVAQHASRRVDLIKFDVEGAERQALDGAEQTLLRFRPKLQVSVYHHPNDLYELPLRLMAALPNYRWYLGHHGPWHTETDLYGVPFERLRNE